MLIAQCGYVGRVADRGHQLAQRYVCVSRDDRRGMVAEVVRAQALDSNVAAGGLAGV
jgi:hypothetical protein